MKERGKEPKPGRHNTYTKRMLDRIINVALFDMQFPFLLALLGREQIAETLGGMIATQIIGTFLVYCVKSFFETKEAEKVRLKEQEMKETEWDLEEDGVAPVQLEDEEMEDSYDE